MSDFPDPKTAFDFSKLWERIGHLLAGQCLRKPIKITIENTPTADYFRLIVDHDSRIVHLACYQFDAKGFLRDLDSLGLLRSQEGDAPRPRESWDPDHSKPVSSDPAHLATQRGAL